MQCARSNDVALPKQVLPIFQITVPSTGKRYNFRQFTVKEEKMMAQAKESDNIEVIVNTVKEVIKHCVDGLDVEKLALFDVEYIITKIRSKSVGEKIDFEMYCDESSKHPTIPVRVDLDKVEVTIPPGHSKNVNLYDQTGVIMKYPTLSDLPKLENMTSFDAIVMCIDQIYTAEEVFEASDHTHEELVEFILGLTEQQKEKIQQSFFDTMPVFHTTIEYKCSECGHQHKKTIRGLASFFA